MTRRLGRRMRQDYFGIGSLSLALVLVICSLAGAASTVPLTLNPLILQNNSGQSGWGGFEDFYYDPDSSAKVQPGSLGRYKSITYDSLGSTGGELLNGGGTGWNNASNNQAPYDQLTAFPVLDIKANDFVILDRAGYGINFNPDLYKLEVVYKPLPTNEAPIFNITFDTYDGFKVEDRYLDPPANTIPAPGFGQGKRYAEQQQWGFGYADVTGNGTTGTGENERGLTIEEYYNANPKDADGFVTISAPLTDGAGAVSDWHRFSGPSYLFASGQLGFQTANTIRGDSLPDFGSFQDLTPNGVVQMHLQSAYIDEDGVAENVGRLHMEIKRISVVPINPDPTEKARLDAMSGVGRRFGTPFTTETSSDGATVDANAIVHEGNTYVINETDQLQRFNQSGFTNLIINTDDDDQLGGFGVWQDPYYQTFDGTVATLEVRAKLTAPLDANHADSIGIVLNDLDGNDLAAGEGGEEYRYNIDLNQFNQTTFTTISISLADFDQRQVAFEMANDGDSSLADFNLYYLGVLVDQGAPGNSVPERVVDLELEYIRVVVPPAGLPGDYNNNGKVDVADYTIWRDNLGSANSLPFNDDSPGVGPDDYARWKTNFGEMAGAGTAAAVPEATAAVLALAACGLMTCVRRRAA